MGIISPIFKKGNKQIPSNYRPVSLTSIPCKILEHIVIIMKHLDSSRLLTSSLRGFVKGRSCVTQLLDVLDHWTKALDNDDSMDCIYLDFAKAFDSVPHQRLRRKVYGYGIRGKIITWVRSFLIGRRQSLHSRCILPTGTSTKWHTIGAVFWDPSYSLSSSMICQR